MNFMLHKLLLNLVRVLFFGNPRKFCAKVEDRELDLIGLTSDDLQSDNNPHDEEPAVTIKIVDIQTIEIVLSNENEITVETTEIVLINEIVVVKTNKTENETAIVIVPAEIEPMKKNEIVPSNEIVSVQNNELVSVPAAAEKSFVVIDALAFYGLTSSKLTEDSVRNIFRKMVLDYHPDRNASTTTDFMQKIYDSKEILLNEVRNMTVTAATVTATATATTVLHITNKFGPVIHSGDILEYSMSLQKKEHRVFRSTTAVITRKRDSPCDTDICYEQPKKRRKRNPAPTVSQEELDAICKQLDNSYITEPVEQISKSLNKLEISKTFAKATKEEQSSMPMGGESHHLKRNGVYLLFEQPCFKRRRKIETKATEATKEEQTPVPMELHDPMDWEEWTPEDTVMGGESSHLKRNGVYLLFEQPCFKRRRRFEREEMNWQTS